MPEYVTEGLEVDSDYASTFRTDTTSLCPSADNHIFENGRRFHGQLAGQYAMPDDKREQDRMNLQHHICLLALEGKLYKSPALKKPQRILDIGTGTGVWAIDCGSVYPESQVIGIDISPIQPKWVPANVTFEVDDIEQVWHHKDNSFDMVHIRQLCGLVSDWPKLYKQAFRILKPGGVLEIQDFFGLENEDGALPEDSHMLKWTGLLVSGIRAAGREVPAKEHAAELTKIGFERIKYDPVKIAVGTWPVNKAEKELGLLMRHHMLEGIEGISLALFTRILGWSKEDLDTLLYGVSQEIKSRKYRISSHLHVTYGRKPLCWWGASREGLDAVWRRSLALGDREM